MRTTFRAKEPYAGILLSCAADYQLKTPERPERFIEKMKHNRGSLGIITGLGCDSDGLERKNPVVVAFGDSVTAGHFESLLCNDDAPVKAQTMSENTDAERIDYEGNPAVEVTDARECYLERFRLKLIDKYEQTSVSTINSGIAGETLIQMSARLERDVIRYQPDLVIINGALNWDRQCGDSEFYKKLLLDVVRKIRNRTEADIVLLTPNGDVPCPRLGIYESTTSDRVKVIRELAVEEKVCLVDVYSIWEEARKRGCPWPELLSNGANHPGVEGHEAYAIALMKLFEG